MPVEIRLYGTRENDMNEAGKISV